MRCLLLMLVALLCVLVPTAVWAAAEHDELKPTGDATSGLSPQGCVSHFDCVDEDTADVLTDGNNLTKNFTGASETFYNSWDPSSLSSIDSVVVTAYTTSSGGTVTWCFITYSGSTTHQLDTSTTKDTWVRSTALTTDPDTDAAWTESAVEGMQFGVNYISSAPANKYFRLECIQLEVYWQSSGAAATRRPQVWIIQ